MSSAPGIAAVRGAVQVAENSVDAILTGTTRLLVALIETNGLTPARIVSALFTTTEDLDADFPAHAARRLGWTEVPMLNAREIPVPGSMARVIRVLLTVRGVPEGEPLVPVYLDGAAALRPDLAGRAPAQASTPPGAAPPTRTPVADATGQSDPQAPTSGPAPDAARGRIALIGLGQIGGSIGLSLAGRGWWRMGWDADASVLEVARAAGAIDEAAPSLAAACAGAALAVIATPVDALAQVIETAAAALPEGAALLDTGSARAPVTGALARSAARVHAVGGHPIAGSEGRGFAAARAGLLEGAPFALMPVAGPVPAIVRTLLTDLGALPHVVDPALHDRALARTSHLPYLVATALREVGAPSADLGLAGPGYRDMTRLAASDPRIALAYCRANANEVDAAWRELRAAIEARVRGLQG